MKAAIRVKSPFSHNILFGLFEAAGVILFFPFVFWRQAFLEYNYALISLQNPCPGVAMICPFGQAAQVPLRGDRRTLQQVRIGPQM
jgi:hypothetical protein